MRTSDREEVVQIPFLIFFCDVIVASIASIRMIICLQTMFPDSIIRVIVKKYMEKLHLQHLL